MVLHLVRHAAHGHVGHILSGRQPGLSLSDRGRAEAGSLAHALARLPLDAVHASPRERAVETAEAVAAPHGLAVEIAPDLDEIDFGAFTGRTFDDLADDPDWRAWNDDRDTARCPGGETMAEAQARILRHLAVLARRHQGGVVASVTHADMIKAAVVHVLGLPLAAIHRFDVDPASVTTLSLGDAPPRLVSLNVVHGEERA
ncbi:histidine phosphatase family protein [Chthonobacter albigriseus]|uniref:histidine phosphatase family protein n=1 Tax=Chthonobacter albigriseus TaxID=1683161 RepID=UPI0015EF5B26|nr:histidine phosphatase family protein [Chthonobacter albigriseus]